MKTNTQGRVMGLVAFIVNLVMGMIITEGDYCQVLLASSVFGLFIMILVSEDDK